MQKINFGLTSKRRSFTIKEKLIFLHEVKKGKKLKEMASIYGVNLRTAQKWRKKEKNDKDYFFNAYKAKLDKKKKKKENKRYKTHTTDEKLQFIKTIEKENGNVSKTAKLLKIPKSLIWS